MQDNEHVDPRPTYCREAVMAFITKHGRVGREQLLDAVFRHFDTVVSELVQSGKVVIERAPENESHLDVFVLAQPEGR